MRKILLIIFSLLLVTTVFCYELPHVVYPPIASEIVGANENCILCQWGAGNLTVVSENDSGYTVSLIRHNELQQRIDIERDSILKWAFSELPEVVSKPFEERESRPFMDTLYCPYRTVYYGADNGLIFYYDNWSIIPDEELENKLRGLEFHLSWELWTPYFERMRAEYEETQKRDLKQCIEILKSSSYPFSENEDDYGIYNLSDSGYDATVDSMTILSVIRKYRNLTKKEALTIIKFFKNNIYGDADGSICGSTGEAFVNDSQYFDLMVHIAREIPDTLKNEINDFLQACLLEYGRVLIDAGAIDINDDELEDTFDNEILPLDSIISLRNSWAEAVKDHPVILGASE